MAAAVKRVEAEEFTTLALETYGFNPYLQKHQVEERVSEFRSFFGVSPLTCEQTWDALIQLNLVHKRSRPVHLLLTLRFLRGYPKEKELMKDFHIRDQRTIRKWIKQYTSHMKLVLATKMIPWEEADDGFLFFMSIDGTHTPINEPRPFSKKWSSFKLGGSAAVNYEIGLQINRDRVLWLNGPTKPGESNDLGVFRDNLKKKLAEFDPGHNRRLIGDGIFTPESDRISTKNDFDTPEVAAFKNRVCARQEFFNHYVKLFEIFATKFRHRDLDFHRDCFHTVVALLVIELENESIHLFDPYPAPKFCAHDNN